MFIYIGRYPHTGVRAEQIWGATKLHARVFVDYNALLRRMLALRGCHDPSLAVMFAAASKKIWGYSGGGRRLDLLLVSTQ